MISLVFFSWVGVILAVGYVTARLIVKAVADKSGPRWVLAGISLIALIVLESPAAFALAHFPEDCGFRGAQEGSVLYESRHGIFGTKCVLIEPGAAPKVDYHDKMGPVAIAYLVGNLVLLGGLYPLAQEWGFRRKGMERAEGRG